jgi:acyl-CoA dehydrogenase
MNEQQMLLADSAGKCFESLGAKTSFAEGWPHIEELSLNLLLISEADGGFGGGWDDALIVLRLAGASALALPVAEAILAASLAPAGTEGFGSISTKAAGSLSGGMFTGALTGVPWGRYADYVVAAIDGAVVLLGKPAAVAEAKNLANEPRDKLTYENAPVTALAAAPLLELAALARTAQMAGAIGAALERSVTYVNEREQFGRKLAKFQAVQQTLASFAAEAAAADCAAQSAAQAMQRGNAGFEIACAKLRANMAAGIATATAHQMHGAIGFTLEYDLHPLTRRLWSWRSEYGSDHFWALRLGNHIATRGAANFWRDLTARKAVA